MISRILLSFIRRHCLLFSPSFFPQIKLRHVVDVDVKRLPRAPNIKVYNLHFSSLLTVNLQWQTEIIAIYDKRFGIIFIVFYNIF